MYNLSISQIKIKIQFIFASISLIFFPISILILEYNQNRYKKPILLLSIILAYIYLSGINNFSGDSVSIQYILYFITVKFLWINYLTRSNIKERKEKVLFISKFLIAFLILSFIITYFTKSNLVGERKVYMLLGSDDQNSTNYINILLMLLAILLFSNFRIIFLFLSIAVLILAFVWQNRTGIILTPIIVLVHLLINKRYFISGSFLLMIIITFPTLLNYSSRLSSLGLETERSIIVLDAFNSMINGDYFYGGYKVSASYLIDETKWTHNLVLDIYRLSGIPGVVVSLVVLAISFIKTCKRNSDLYLGIFCWVIGFVISMTSVVLESTMFEFLIIFILLFNFYFLTTLKVDNNLTYS